MKILCIYHANCADGFGAAWAVRHAVGPDNFEGVAATHGSPPPDVAGRRVVIVDFSYPYDVLAEMARAAESVIVLDHHKTAADDLARLPQFCTSAPNDGTYNMHWQAALDEGRAYGRLSIAVCFDMTRSGARLAWDCFHPGQEPPKLLQHIEDRDLWRFALPCTREVQANLFSYPYDFEAWDALMAMDPALLIADGTAIERKHHKDIAELLKVCQRRMVIGGVDVPVANLPYTMSSDAGHQMAQGEPFAACYWDTPTGRTFSLRSSAEGIDVSEIARIYGGGGHRNAAGFSVPADHHLASRQAAEPGFAEQPVAEEAENQDDRFEKYVQSLIDHNPDVQALGDRLARLLDGDQWNNIEPTLLGIAAKLSATRPADPAAVPSRERLIDVIAGACATADRIRGFGTITPREHELIADAVGALLAGKAGA